MKINDIKENFALPNISYDKYGMPNYSPYLEIITKAFKDKDLGKVQIQRFLEDKLGIRARLARELIQRWEKVNKEKIPLKLNAEAGGGGGGAGGGGAGGGGAAGGTGGTGGATGGTSSGGDGGSADGGSTGDSGTTSSDSTPSDAPTMSAPRGGYYFLGSMAPYKKSKKKKKKKKSKQFKFGDGIYENVEQMEDKLWDLKSALESARAETKNIKYADMHMDIISKVSNIAEENGIELDEYNINQVYRAKNNLESAIYQLEEDFEEAIRELQNAIDMYDED